MKEVDKLKRKIKRLENIILDHEQRIRRLEDEGKSRKPFKPDFGIDEDDIYR